ncbi:hypothetical protein FRC09_019678, partial [Ceratobasidium sp. 395]
EAINDSPSYREAVSDPRHASQWRIAMDEELNMFTFKKVYDVVKTPAYTRLLRCLWVLKLKFDQDGKPLRYKARLVVLGNHQRPGYEFTETFASTVRMDSVRIVLSLANSLDYDIHQMDVTSAYLNALLKEDIYVQPPEGSNCPRDHCWKLNKTVYGLHQGAVNWQNHFTARLRVLGFTRCVSDHCVWYRREPNCAVIIMFYVDDIVICSTKGHVDRIKQEIKTKYDCKDMGEISSFLGMKITRDRVNGTLKLSLPAYIDRINKIMGLEEANPARSPMSSTLKLKTKAAGDPTPNYPYPTAIGQLIWASITCRPEISYATNLLAACTHNYGSTEITAVKRVFRWLKGTRDFGITYRRDTWPFMEVGYSDSDFGSQPGRRSISGNVFLFGGAAVSWMSKRQHATALSTQEAEYMALASATSQALYIRMFIKELGWKANESTHIFCDNHAAIKLASDPTHYSATKHIDLRLHFVREHVSNKDVVITQVPTADNLADGFTKALPHAKFWYLFDSVLGLHEEDFVDSFDELEPGEIYED